MQAHPIWTWIGFSLNLSHIILNKPQAVRRGETLLAAVSTESTIYSRTINNLPLKGPWHPSRAKKPLHLILSKGSLLKRLLSVNGRQLSFDSDSEIKYTERRYQSLSVEMYGEGLAARESRVGGAAFEVKRLTIASSVLIIKFASHQYAFRSEWNSDPKVHWCDGMWNSSRQYLIYVIPKQPYLTYFI